MNAAPATSRAPQPATDAAPGRAGHTRITARALTRVIEAITAEAFGINPESVTVDIHDVRGRLGLTTRVALPVPDLLQAAHPGSGTDQTESVYAHASRARAVIIRRAALVAGAEVARVDILITAAHQGQEARVR